MTKSLEKELLSEVPNLTSETCQPDRCLVINENNLTGLESKPWPQWTGEAVVTAA